MGNTLKDLIKNPPVGINNPLLEKLMMEERKKQHRHAQGLKIEAGPLANVPRGDKDDAVHEHVVLR